MAFRHIPHTADVTLEATAASLAEAFSEACRGFTAVMIDEPIEQRLSHPIDVRAESLEAAFFEFLSALVVLLDAEGFVPAGAEVSVRRGDAIHVHGTVVGDDVNRYDHHGDVKAPTYHELSVEQTDEGWRVAATLDL